MIIKDNGWDKVEIACAICKNRRITNRYNAKATNTHWCVSCRNSKIRQGKIPWNKGKVFESKIVGNSYIDSHGYRQVWCGKLGKGRKDGYGLEHRVKLEEHLQRKLLKEEIVHHIDGDKLNNILTNLFVCDSISNHRLIHSSLENVAFQLVKLGFIVFNNGSYQIAPHISDGMSGSGEFGESLSP